MCGIGGIILTDSPAHEQLLRPMMDAMHHRGPDGEGFYTYQNIGIGHKRLAIIDLETGKQPISNENGTIWITFNGEIYNYLELRKILLQSGHQFYTNSDTEAIVHAYEEWGSECVTHLRGMFAFAILDQNKKEVFLARDHFGIKPLVYAQSKKVFAFASEIQALRAVGGIDWSIDFLALDQFMQIQYIPSPRTAFKEVKKLPPAHFLRVGFDGQVRQLARYWQLNFNPDNTINETDWLEGLDAVLKESVNAHLVSDVPFGAFLSGGIDSSLVVGCMAQTMQRPVKTFSIGFEEKEFNETQYALQVASHWDTEHHVDIAKPDALSLLPRLVKHYGEPFGDNSAIPTFYVSQLARKHVTMVLTGDGGDEIFAGYESYTTRWHRHLTPIPEHLSPVKNFAYQLLHKFLPNRYPYRSATINDWLRYGEYFGTGARQALWKKDFADELIKDDDAVHASYFSKAKNFGHFQKAQFVDFNTYMTDAVLRKVDIASMMNSLETRTPLLDIKVVEFAARIPESMNISKVNGVWLGKKILKKLAASHHGNEFAYRNKMGFATPIKHWLSNTGKESEITNRLLTSGNGLDQLFNMQTVSATVKAGHGGQLWLLLFLQEWLSQLHEK
jgi:asparagine synthase (glutamine-hydrolysing)